MSKFKVGDEVRVPRTSGYSGGEDVPSYMTRTGWVRTGASDSNVQVWNEDKTDWWPFIASDLELVTSKSKEKKQMGRRTFKLIKDTPTARKGGLWQEDCEDGTQPYSLITQEYAKGASGPYSVVDRKLVEEAPEWFVEVFKVEPEYMTQVELDKWNLFKKGLKPAKRKYTKRTVKPVKKAVRLSKNGKRLGHPPKAQK